MISIHKKDSLGVGDYSWLKARYHFSFAQYDDPQKRGIGPLWVINDDTIAPRRGFPLHPHQNMEIITYVRTGAITHKDNLGNEGITSEGNVQVMSAGTGILHSEYNLTDTETTLYQIWIAPRLQGVTPRWESRAFPQENSSHGLTLLVSGKKEDSEKGALFIHQDAEIYGGRLQKGSTFSHTFEEDGYLLISKGKVTLQNLEASQGDGIEVRDEKEITVFAQEDSEILLIHLGKNAVF